MCGVLTGESAHDFAFQFFGHGITELGGYFSCYILGLKKQQQQQWLNIVLFGIQKPTFQSMK